MKKLLLAFIPLLLLNAAAMAQATTDNRTLQTRIADILAKFPATDSRQLNSLMNEMVGLGETGIVEMANMLTPPGKGDNTKLQYALGGFTYYASRGNQENLRLLSSQAYSNALQQLTDPDAKAFIITQLQLVGKDEAVAGLEKYLSNERLCDPAARALAKINSTTSQKALLNALTATAPGNCQLSLVEALGDSRNAEAVAAISPLANSSDKKLKKLALYALANIGDPSSETPLAAEAAKSGFTFEETDATSSYLRWAKRMIETGNTQAVDKMARTLLATCKQDNQVHTKTAALKLLVDVQGEKSMPLLLAAANDKNPEYRAAALKYANAFKGKELTVQWSNQGKKDSPEAQADILTMLGNRQDETALPILTQQLKSKNPAIKLAAIQAIGKLAQESSLPGLLEVMKTADTTEINAVKNALFSMKGASIGASVSNAIPSMPPKAKAALLEVLGTRKASDKTNEVLALANDPDADVKLAARNALKNLATQDNLPALFPLLLSAGKPAEIAATQAAITNALGGVADKAKRTDLVLQQMSQAPAAQKRLFYGILANLGGSKALEAVTTEFNQGNAESKKDALTALGNWADAGAATELFRIAQSSPDKPYFDQALQGYVRRVHVSKYPADQKFLLLRKAMDIAQAPGQKQAIMQEIANNPTFPALLFAGKFLDDAAVQQEAARAVMAIALSDQAYNGNDVREMLNKTIGVLSGTDTEYMKTSISKHLAEMPKGPGFVPLFNGKDLTGWKGLVANPIERAKMNAKTLAREQQKADEAARKDWTVENGLLVFKGHGNNLSTEKKYGDFELYVDWKITKDGDAGIYLRGTPQVQIWDTTRHDVGAQVGSGGLYNNKKNESKPSKVADNAIGEWNTFRILMKGERVTVYLNGEQVVNNVALENYWDPNLPIFPEEQIELQAHGTEVAYRDIYIREIPRPQPFVLPAEEQKDGFKVLFDGTDMNNWTGNTQDYVVEEGSMVIYPQKADRGNLYTKDEYGDFIFRFEFQLTPGANNGLGIRAPLEGDAAYVGMELQILDNEADIYKDLKPYQYHGSVYGVIPAKRGYLKPVGEWNYEEVVVKGSKVKVILNGTVITDGDIAEASQNGTMDHQEHPGLKRTSGHIGFLGHGSVVKFRNIRVKDLGKKKS